VRSNSYEPIKQLTKEAKNIATHQVHLPNRKTWTRNSISIIARTTDFLVPNISPESTFRVTAKRPVPKRATIHWAVVNGSGIASIVAGEMSAKAHVCARSSGVAILRVEVRYDNQVLTAQTELFVTTPANVKVLSQSFTAVSGRRFGYEKVLQYQLLNHAGDPLEKAGILMTEQLDFKNSTLETEESITLKMQDGALKTFLKSSFKTGQQQTNHLGMFGDHLRLTSLKSLPKNTKITIEQTLRANGIVVSINTLEYTAKNVRVIKHENSNAIVFGNNIVGAEAAQRNTMLAS
jgi:hypothetical protein